MCVCRSRNILDDFREAYYWLRQNTHDKARVMSWWDYGYQIAGMANRTTLVDNNTWNNSHIAMVSLDSCDSLSLVRLSVVCKELHFVHKFIVTLNLKQLIFCTYSAQC